MTRIQDSTQIRALTAADIPAIAALADAKRTEYAAYAPVFWRNAAAGIEAQSRFFHAQMLPSPAVISLVAEVDGVLEGFVMAVLRDAPPVYAPGGPVCWIDDFTVRSPALWDSVGAALYHAAAAEAQQRGAVAVVILTAHLDSAKRALLHNLGAALTVETWTQTLETNG